MATFSSESNELPLSLKRTEIIPYVRSSIVVLKHGRSKNQMKIC